MIKIALDPGHEKVDRRRKPKKKCSVGDCERFVQAKLWCIKHYQRMLYNGTMYNRLEDTFEERMVSHLAKAITVLPSTCLVMPKNYLDKRGGYAIVKYRKKRYKLHRVAYTLVHGEISDGLWVCHSCDNPSCINPKHLFLGTPRDNYMDMVNKQRRIMKRGKDGRYVG